MKTIYYLFAVFTIVNGCLFFSCKERKSNKIKYYKESIIKELIVPNKEVLGDTIVCSFYENGNIKEIHRFNRKGQYVGEQLFFYPDGTLDRKIRLKNGIADGNAYYFYDTSGTLNGHRYFRNDKEVFHGTDYWEDSIGIIQSSLYFNDSGQVYYKKNYDKNGNLISEEGKQK